MARESLLQTKALEYLRGQGIYCLNLYGDGRSGKGKPDVVACIDGRFVALEFKVGANGLQDDQIIHKRRIERSGGVHYTVRTLDEVYHILKEVTDANCKY